MHCRTLFAALMVTTACVAVAGAQALDRASEGEDDASLAGVAVGPMDGAAHMMPTWQVIAPAGTAIEFPGRPNDLAVSPDGKTACIKNALHSRSNEVGELIFIDVASAEVRQVLELPDKACNSFHGVVYSKDGRSVWTTDAKGFLRRADLQEDGLFTWGAALLLPDKNGKGESVPGGIALDEERGRLYVTLSVNNTVGVVTLDPLALEKEIPVGMAPYTVAVAGNTLYVTNWGGRRPAEGDVTGPTTGARVVVDPDTGVVSTGTVSVVDRETLEPVADIAVGLHPCGLAVSPDAARVYVTNANSDTVSVIDVATRTVAQTFSTRPLDELPFGSAPNALALSPDGATLYVANGTNNAIAVLDAASGEARGLIPTGWYPGGVEVTADGAYVCIANTKGIGSRSPKTNEKLKSEHFGDLRSFNSHDHTGSATLVPTPSQAELDEMTYKAAANMRLPRLSALLKQKEVGERAVPVPMLPGEKSRFKHVIYIIKENRTYDQVFGDMPQGNGEPELCMFGREVTPNHHAIAEEFVLLDNFYCNGVLSADGHQWTDEGYVTDYIEKQFGDWPRSYPYDGDDAMAYASSGFIWDHVLRAGLTFRDYGEFVKAKIEPSSATWTDIYNDYLNDTKTVSIRSTTELHTLEPYLCPTYVGFPGKVQDVYRAREFLREFKQFEEDGNLPNFIIMLLPNDHTNGTSPGFPTPEAMVADNDLALGRMVEAISKSRYWPETAIFVVEDDPQAGLDHVDGHRTVAFCISPYTKRGVVDSSFYNQTGMLRTMELILGLAPMNQMTMMSNPMTNCFMEEPDLTPYTARDNNIPLDRMNPELSSLSGKQLHYAQKSLELPLDDIDEADEDTFNEILWHAVKGYDTPYPKLARHE